MTGWTSVYCRLEKRIGWEVEGLMDEGGGGGGDNKEYLYLYSPRRSASNLQCEITLQQEES